MLALAQQCTDSSGHILPDRDAPASCGMQNHRGGLSVADLFSCFRLVGSIGILGKDR